MKTMIAFLALVLCPLVNGMDRMSALSQLETGDQDGKIGRAGEVSRYQVMPKVWAAVSTSKAYKNPAVARQVVSVLIQRRVERFKVKFGREPSNFEFYVLWNAPAQAYRGKVSPVVAERAQRFSNLCSAPTLASN